MATQISVETLSPIAYNQIPVITTELLAQLYGTETVNIKMNFSRNSARFVQGKHFFKLEGNELREFKHRLNRPGNPGVKWHTEFGHLNRGDMLTSEQHRCSN
ncbi:ORF6N domain-containing protein, partial [Escherichia coli]|uniref:ORF6N domain-containing protein n=1 Tax=Escherichia coli TaxID=562 RepID=UPI003D36DD21